MIVAAKVRLAIVATLLAHLYLLPWTGALAETARLSATTNVLSPEGKEAAELLGITAEVAELLRMKEQGNYGTDVLSDHELAVRVRVMDKVMGASLEVRMVSDRIDRELSWAYIGKGMIDSRRQRNVNYLVAGNFMQGGILGTLSGPLVLDEQPKASTEVLLVASTVGMGLSLLSVLASHIGWKKIDGETTVLADLFNLPQKQVQTTHPSIVYKFLNSPAPESGTSATRLDKLKEAWKKGNYLKTTNEHWLARLAAVKGTKGFETSGLLACRIRMLYDTQGAVQQLDHGLLDIMRVVSPY